LPASPFLSPLDSPPPTVDVEVTFGARSRPGPSRAICDEHYLVFRMGRNEETLMTSLTWTDIPRRVEEYSYGMVIADGIGSAGEAASRIAISTLMHLGIYFGKWNVRIDEPTAEEVMDRADRFYRSINSTLLQAGHQSPHGMQTTLTAVYTAGAELFLAHVGHSRAYLFRDGELTQLTRDHTLGEASSGATAADKVAKARDGHHVLTEALGGRVPGGTGVDVERFGLRDRDTVLLCTNGLTDVVDDGRIGEELAAHNTPDDQCGALVDLAARARTRDDVTAVVAHYRIA
jgi:PPM family protein phosphatase